LLWAHLAGDPVRAQKYEPKVYQEGKDVIWVPTPDEVIKAMLDMARVTPADYVIDLGSGDGRIVIAAAKRGARALGIEFNPDMVELSRESAQKEGVGDKASFVQGDIFASDFSKATVLTMYLLPTLNMKLRPQILQMKPGTRVATHAFSMEDWEPDQSASVDGRTAYLWIVPAKAEGIWTWREGSDATELSIRQTFQKVEGTLRMAGKEMPLKNARLQGEQIQFEISESASSMRVYSGRISGDTISGTCKTAKNPAAQWAARRTGGSAPLK
jgi:hypothetical protein